MKPGKPEPKLDRILMAAQTRFGHYGLSKTTMNDIAADIGMSKASLYYYFKDKESIFIAVVKKEKDFFEEELNSLMKKTLKARVMLTGYVTLRIELLKTLLTLGKFSSGTYLEIKPVLASQMQELRDREIKIITEIIKKGITGKEFVVDNAKRHAELFVDTLAGLRKASFGGFTNPGMHLLASREYQKLKRQSEMFVELFIRGIAA